MVAVVRTDREGSEAPTIMCNGHAVTIGANLFSALKKIRSSQKPRIVWVDALCINQEDAIERSLQVGMMGTIFESAFRVLIWLGEGLDENVEARHQSLAYRAFSAVCNIVNSWRERSELENEVIVATHSPHIAGPQREDLGDLLSSSLIDWQALFQLYNSGWFRRLWVIQEAARARAAVVLWDGCEIAWDHVGMAAAIVRTNFGRLPESARTVQGFMMGSEEVPKRTAPTGVINAYFVYRLSSSQSYSEPLIFAFHELLRLTRQFECKDDDRDRIYGLLGLQTSDKISLTIKPDYSKSTQDVYFEIASKVLDSPSSLSLLSSVQPNRKTSTTDSGRIYDSRYRPIEKESGYAEYESLYTPDEPEQDYPSWVPQFQFVFTSSLAPPCHHPAFAPSGSRQVVRRHGDDQRQLQLRGVVFDTISVSRHPYKFSFTRGAYQAARDDGDNQIWMRDELGYEQTLDDILQKGTLTKTKLESLALTLTGGKNWYGLPVEDRSAHLADYVKCLLKEGCLWSVREDFVLCDAPHKKEENISMPKPKRQKIGPTRRKFGYDSSMNFQDSSIALDAVAKKDLEILAQGGNADRFLDACATACGRRSFFQTTKGFPGVGPGCLKEGDAVCILYGSNVPFIIRPTEVGEYLLVGECYVHGVMSGEIMQQMESPGTPLKETWITLT